MSAANAEAMLRLPYDAVFRIEVSLSSQTTSVIVMRTTARLYSLEGAQTTKPRQGDAEWKSLAYGAPCIQLLRHGNGESYIFTIRIVIAEVESGIALWETELDANCHYVAMQSNFHTFTSSGNTYAIQFVSEEEAGRMLESVHDLLIQQQQLQQKLATPLSSSSLPDTQPVVFKKPSKPLRRLSKKDISAPCNFKHVSGITMQRTSSCEQELKGTIQRKMRSLSLSNLSRNKTVEESVAPSEPLERKLSKRVKSFKRKTGKEGGADMSLKRNDPWRMSLPSHFHQRQRPAITPASFVPPSTQLNKSLSQSQGDISNSHPSHTLHPQSHTLHPPSVTSVEQSLGHRPINYYQTTPTHHMPTHPSQSDSTLNHVPYQPVPIPAQEQVQHVAIASSDILGWTADGRLIVQMPAGNQSRHNVGGVSARSQVGGVSVRSQVGGVSVRSQVGGVSVRSQVGGVSVRSHLTRRASTGQFASDTQPQQLRYGSTDALSVPASSSHEPPHKPPEMAEGQKRSLPPSNRPLPPTPLDIAMPQSQSLRKRPQPPLVAHGDKESEMSKHKLLASVHENHPHTFPRQTTPPASTHSHGDSVDETLQEVTDQMSRALAQFDELLGIAQTSL